MNDSRTTLLSTSNRNVVNNLIPFYDLVYEFNIALKKIALYPAEHPLIAPTLQRLVNICTALMRDNNGFSLGTVKSTLVVNGLSMDKSNPAVRSLALTLYNHRITAVTFKTGLTSDELRKFLVLLSTPTDSEMDYGAISELITKTDITHIKIKEIDFRRFSLSHEKKKVTSANNDRDKKTRRIENQWIDFAAELISQLQKDKTLDESPDFDPNPKKLAELINEKHETDNSYSNVILKYIQQRYNELLNADPEKILEIRNKLSTLILNLNSSLKSQLLSIGNQPEIDKVNLVSSLVDLLPYQEIIEIIESINLKDSAIHSETQTLFSKLKLLANDKDELREVIDKKLSESEVTNPKDEFKERFENVLTSKTDHDYLPERYRTAMNKFSKSTVVDEDPDKISTIYLSGYLKTLKKDVIMERVVLTAVEVINIVEDQTEYSELTKYLADTIERMLDKGNYHLVNEILQSFISHASRDNGFPRENIQRAAEVIESFCTREMSSKIVSALQFEDKSKYQDLAQLLQLIGKPAVFPLLETLSVEEKQSVRREILNILKNMGPCIVPELLIRLNDERWYVVRNMMFLLREVEAKETKQRIASFIHHRDWRVRIETMKTLVAFEPQNAFRILKQSINDRDSRVQEFAVSMFGTLKIQEAFPLLKALIEQRRILDHDHHLKIPAVAAIGKINRAAAAPILKKVIKTRHWFFENRFAELKDASEKALQELKRKE